jgi:hypothetical protein
MGGVEFLALLLDDKREELLAEYVEADRLEAEAEKPGPEPHVISERAIALSGQHSSPEPASFIV